MLQAKYHQKYVSNTCDYTYNRIDSCYYGSHCLIDGLNYRFEKV